MEALGSLRLGGAGTAPDEKGGGTERALSRSAGETEIFCYLARADDGQERHPRTTDVAKALVSVDGEHFLSPRIDFPRQIGATFPEARPLRGRRQLELVLQRLALERQPPRQRAEHQHAERVERRLAGRVPRSFPSKLRARCSSENPQSYRPRSAAKRSATGRARSRAGGLHLLANQRPGRCWLVSDRDAGSPRDGRGPSSRLPARARG